MARPGVKSSWLDRDQRYAAAHRLLQRVIGREVLAPAGGPGVEVPRLVEPEPQGGRRRDGDGGIDDPTRDDGAALLGRASCADRVLDRGEGGPVEHAASRRLRYSCGQDPAVLVDDDL